MNNFNNIIIKSFLLTISTILAFFTEIYLILYVITAVVILDMITAILRTISIEKPKSFINKLRIIKSKKLKKTALKLIFWTIFIMLIYSVEIAIFGTRIYIVNFAAFLIIFSELVSIAENLDICLETNKFTYIIREIQKIFTKKIADKIESDDK